MAIPSSCSWIWRKVLQLRPLALSHISYIVGNGSLIHLWHDPWMAHTAPHPSLLISNSRLGDNAKVADIILNGQWNLPASNQRAVITFRDSFYYNRPITNGEDTILWDNKPARNVNTSFLWESIRMRNPPFIWSKLLWHSWYVPRYSFTLWMAMHKKLPTKDKLGSFTNICDTSCPLCKNMMETNEHLFFDCSFAYAAVLPVFAKCNWFPQSLEWNSTTSYIKDFSGPKSHSLLLKLCLSTSVYKIWEERNRRIFKNSSSPARVISSSIISSIKCKLHRTNSFLKAVANDGVLQLWCLD